VVQAVQWAVVLFYTVLVVVPALLPLPPVGASVLNDLTLFAQFVFWGVWWPGVIAATVLLGRSWCGLFCPEGSLSEFASRHGLGRSIPRWMRWRGWPTVAFVITTVYGQLISVYEYPRAALLVLGGSTVAAVAVGLVWGRGKRVWCRHLCPVSGVFALLVQLAPLHFRADDGAWRRHAGPAPAVDCAPLLPLRQLNSAAACHACGRCSGHRGAISLTLRSPNAEILSARPAPEASAVLLVFGLLGVACGAFQWTLSPLFVMLKQVAADWLVAHEAWALLDGTAPWWLLTHEPMAADVFTWLDGGAILAYIGGYTALAGGLSWSALGRAAGKLGPAGPSREALAMALVPLAAAGLLLGLSMTTVSHLRAEGWALAAASPLRAVALAGATAWSAVLAWKLVCLQGIAWVARLVAWAWCAVPVAVTAGAWVLTLFVW
jgi:polyferredoxin